MLTHTHTRYYHSRTSSTWQLSIYKCMCGHQELLLRGTILKQYYYFLEGELFFFLQFLFFESFMHVCNGILITATSPQMLFSCANMLAVLVFRSLSAVIPGCRALAYNPQNKGDYFQMLLVNPFSPGLKKKTEAVWKTHIFFRMSKHLEGDMDFYLSMEAVDL